MQLRNALFLCFALMFSTATTAQTPNTAPSSAEPTTEMIELRRAGYAANYNLDYTTARAKFEEIRKRWPHHPAGDLYVANIIWLEHLYKLRRLQTGLYQNESFYAGFEGSKDNEQGDSVEAKVDREFRALMTTAKAKAMTLVNMNRNDPHARYYLGAVYSVMAAYEASTARKFWSALRNGSKGIDAHQQVLKMKPDYYDAYLSVGLYDYVIGNLPFAVKALIAMGGVRGNKERGIKQLNFIIENKAENADDARVMLIGIYQNENKPEAALAILQEFTQRYPNNFLFRLEFASVLSQLKRKDEAIAAFEALLKEAGSNSPAARAMDLIRFQYAEALAKHDEFARAAQQFLAAAKENNAEPGLVTMALLRAGQVYDLAELRNEALAQYKVVLTRPNVYDSREQAQKGLKQPYKKA
jgi:tetratricopeptide (TPR) repeat protein